jgi:hypothetical protein
MKRRPAFLMGAVLGICFLVLAVIADLFIGMKKPHYFAFLITPVASPRPPSLSPTATQFSPETSSTASTGAAPETILTQAQQLLISGQPEKVAGLLQPVMDTWNSPDDLAAANKNLGQAEMDMGHPKLAAAYFEKLFIYQPTADNLFLMAVAYDAGGENKKALDKYLLLAALDNAEGQFNREYVHMRIQNLGWVLGTRTPQSP